MALITCVKCGERYYGQGCPTCDFTQLPEPPEQARARRVGGAIALTVGIACSLPGFLRHGPAGQRALVFVIAGIFALAGVQLLTNAKGRLSWLMVSAVVAGLSVMMFVAAFGPGHVSGGLIFLPYEWNQHLGRFFFGAFGVLAAMMALLGLWRAVKPTPGKNS